MIGRLVLSNRNIYKIKIGNKQISARICNILSKSNDDILVKTSKEFNLKDAYIILNPQTNTIIESLGFVGNESDDLNIYYHLFTNGWMSNSKYSKLWESYLSNNDSSQLKRIDYTKQVITIDPNGSIDLDDGFSFDSDDSYYYLDIHIADVVSWFNFSNPLFIPIFNELKNRLQTCYITQTNQSSPNHLLPRQIVELISLLEIKPNSNIKFRKAVSFCFKISKQTKLVETFDLKFTNLSNITNYSYENYDEYLNSNLETKKEHVKLSNDLIDIIGYKSNLISIDMDISHKMIEIFMILTNWYGGNYLLNTMKSKPILRVQNSNDMGNDFDIKIVPKYARPFLSTSANYIIPNSNISEYLHYSLEISNYAHLSSPMRRFIDIVNHMVVYKIDYDNYLNQNDLKLINQIIKFQKKITNGYDLIKFIKINKISNKFKACLFDWVQNNRIIGLLVLYQPEYKFVKMVNVEIPSINIELKKYMEFDVELYYNSNNFESTTFPFSIKII